MLNGYELAAAVDDAERVVLGVAAGAVDRAAFTAWVRGALTPLGGAPPREA